MMKRRMNSRRWRRSWRWEGRRRGSDVIEEFLVWQPAPAREHSSEGFEPRKVIEAKEEDGYEENVEEDFAVAANDEDDGKVWNLSGKFLVQWWVFKCSRGRWRLFLTTKNWFLIVGIFIISVKCSVLISFFISDLPWLFRISRKRQIIKMEMIMRTKTWD